MKKAVLRLCLAILFCAVMSIATEPASATDANGYQGIGANFNKSEQRFSSPADPTLAFKNAEQVVINEVDPSSVPASVLADTKLILKNCIVNGVMPPELKAYSYVSAHIRSHGYGANYLVDYAGLVNAPCAANRICAAGTCPLVVYSATGADHWNRGEALRQVSWTTSQIKLPKHPFPVTLFNVKQCAADNCTTYRIWLSSGWADGSSYAPPPPAKTDQ